ncbi:MAG: hypothetical protein AB3N18_02765, partial [Allomuricauda sp.]
MKKTSIVLIMLLLGSIAGFGQSSNADKSSFINMPKESVYIQHNESLLFTGENLMYKLYNVDKSTKKASELSQMAYVTLIGKDGKSV